MSSKPVVPRRQAEVDVEQAIDHYLSADAQAAALAFIEDLEAAYRHLGRHPSSGSPRYGHELSLSGIRCWRLKRYPYSIFYVEHSDHVDVWRLLHQERDIPACMQAQDED